MAGIKGKSGPPGNQNAVGNVGGTGRPTAHGMTAFLANAKLPAKCGYITRRLRGFQAALQQGVLDRGGEIDIYAAAIIQSALRHEGRVQLLHRWLRLAPELELSDRLAILRDVSAATEKRDSCLEKLSLDVRGSDSIPWPTAGDVFDDKASSIASAASESEPPITTTTTPEGP